MVRAKPGLSLTVPNAVDSVVYSHASLITPRSYLVSGSLPLLTPFSSRSSTNTMQSESHCELDRDEDDDEVFLGEDTAAWTPDQDEALLRVMFRFCESLTRSGLFYAFGWTSATFDT